MDDDKKLARDESRRTEQHEALKSKVGEEVQTEVAERAEERPADQAQAEALARKLKQKAVAEVVESEAEIARGKTAARISQTIDYLFYLIYGIIGLEIVLDLIGARQSSGFKQFVDTISAPLLAPFRGLMPNPSHGPFRLMLSYIVAVVVYVLFHLAINGLLRLFVHRKTEV